VPPTGCQAGCAGWRVPWRHESEATCVSRRARNCGRAIRCGCETRPRYRRTRMTGSCATAISHTDSVKRNSSGTPPTARAALRKCGQWRRRGGRDCRFNAMKRTFVGVASVAGLDPSETFAAVNSSHGSGRSHMRRGAPKVSKWSHTKTRRRLAHSLNACSPPSRIEQTALRMAEFSQPPLS